MSELKDYIENNFDEVKYNLDSKVYIGKNSIEVYSKRYFEYSKIFLEIIEEYECKNILILGEGIGQTSSLLDNNLTNVKITGVDNIKLLSELSIKNTYNNSYERINSDVFEFIDSCKEKFDIILVDIYDTFESKIPDKIIDYCNKIQNLSKYIQWNILDNEQANNLESKIELEYIGFRNYLSKNNLENNFK